MFNFLKSDPHKKLQKQYEKTLAEAFQAQRNGRIELFAELTAKAEAIRKELDGPDGTSA